MNIKNIKMIELSDFDDFVLKTYGRVYSFQQQDGCKERGIFKFTVPRKAEDFENDTIPEIINGDDMGVSFKAWLERDPKQPLVNKFFPTVTEQYRIDLWWDRNFYPNVQMVVNDLHAKGLLEAGDYCINIDW